MRQDLPIFRQASTLYSPFALVAYMDFSPSYRVPSRGRRRRLEPPFAPIRRHGGKCAGRFNYSRIPPSVSEMPPRVILGVRACAALALIVGPQFGNIVLSSLHERTGNAGGQRIPVQHNSEPECRHPSAARSGRDLIPPAVLWFHLALVASLSFKFENGAAPLC